MDNVTARAAEAGAPAARPPAERKPMRRAVWASLIGTVLEQYDMVLFGTASALIFNKVFFPEASPAVGLIASFGAYGVGFLARPLGGLFFSHFGEKLGRKWILVTTLFLMGAATFAIGLLPTYAAAGIVAPLLLVLCRLLQGFGAGAEQTGAITLLTESAPRESRGRYASVVAVGSGLGIVLGGGAWTIAQALLSPDALLSWGWRIVFFTSVFVTITAYVIRRRMRESPVFEEVKRNDAEATTARAPMRELMREGKRPFLTVLGMTSGTMFNGYVFLAFMSAYLATWQDVDGVVASNVVVVGALATAVAAFGLGTLSDRVGRRPVMLGVAAFLLVYPPIAFLLIGTGTTFGVYVGVALGFAIAVAGGNGAHAAYLAELFGSRNRLAGVTLARELSSMVAGGFAPLVCSALIAWAVGSWWPIAVVMSLTALISLLTTLSAPETRGRDLVDEKDAFGR
ncbi:MFS transporter [Pseudonocardia pini]|uniref:MFS transporter n=1 Tax=Pseudonocardia pini TaxID=2758030 RepID=UPI0015F0F86D|nr:MFS transporter [Pseudonocardia pini]